jgi:hypothetical protein
MARRYHAIIYPSGLNINTANGGTFNSNEGLPVARLFLGKRPTAVAVVRAGIGGRITVDYFAPTPGKQHADAITFPFA